MKEAGFTRQQIADALEFCDNDRERVRHPLRGPPPVTYTPCSLWTAHIGGVVLNIAPILQAFSWLKKQQKGGGKLQWNDALRAKLQDMPSGQLKNVFTKMLEYNNVPIKPKTFKNFAKNSFALQRNEALVEEMWKEFEPLVRKKPAAQPHAPVSVPSPTQSSAPGVSRKRDRSDPVDDACQSNKTAKKARKAVKAVLAALDDEILSSLIAGLDAGVDLPAEIRKAAAVEPNTTCGDKGSEKKSKKKKKEKKKKDKKEK